MSVGELGEYAKSLFAPSPCMHRFFPRILQIHLNTFHIFGADFVYSTLPCSPYTLKYFPRILQLCRKNEEYPERILPLSTMPGDFKGTVFRKNGMWGYKLA